MNSDTQPNVFLVTGDDPAMIAAETAKVIRRVAGDNPDPFCLDILREREGVALADLVRQAVRAVLSPPFLGGHKTVWLKEFSGFGADSASATPKTPEAAALRELAAQIVKGLPADIVLVMDGPGADLEKPLAKACAARGKVIACDRPKLRNRDWRSEMRGLIERRAADKGASLPAEVVDYLTDVIGTDTGRIEGELEKLICYAGGPGQPISREAAEQLCVGQGEELPWALTNALGRRDVGEALRTIRVLLEEGRDDGQGARALLGQMARFYRELLQMKVFMAERGLRSPQAVVGALQRLSSEEKERYREEGLGVVTGNAFRGRPLAEQAGAYSGPELIAALRGLRDAYLRCVTSGVPERVALEDMVIRTAAPAAPPRR